MSSTLDSQFTNSSITNSNNSEDYPSLSKINLSQTIDVQNAKLISPSIATGGNNYYNKNSSNNSLNNNYNSEKEIMRKKPTQNHQFHQNYYNNNYAPNSNPNNFNNQMHRHKYNAYNENMNQKYNYKNPGFYDRNIDNKNIPPKYNYPPNMWNQYMYPPPPFGFPPQSPGMLPNYLNYQNYQPYPYPPDNYGPYEGNYYGY